MFKVPNDQKKESQRFEKYHEEKAYFYAKLNIDYFSGNMFFMTRKPRRRKCWREVFKSLESFNKMFVMNISRVFGFEF